MHFLYRVLLIISFSCYWKIFLSLRDPNNPPSPMVIVLFTYLYFATCSLPKLFIGLLFLQTHRTGRENVCGIVCYMLDSHSTYSLNTCLFRTRLSTGLGSESTAFQLPGAETSVEMFTISVNKCEERGCMRCKEVTDLNPDLWNQE